MSTWFQGIVGFHNSIGARDEAASSWLTIKASGVARPRLPQKTKSSSFRDMLNSFTMASNNDLVVFATRVIRVQQIIDMGDRDKGEPTIELIEIVPFPKHSHGLEICSQVCHVSVDTRSDLRREFHKYSLEPRALLQVHILVVVDVLAS